MKARLNCRPVAPRLFVLAAGWIAATVVVFGYFLDVQFARSLTPGLPSMRFTNAVCLILAAYVMWVVVNRRPPGVVGQTLLGVCVCGIVMLSGASLVSALVGVPIGFEAMFPVLDPKGPGQLVPGRPSLGSLCALISLALAGISTVNGNARVPVIAFSSLAVGVGLVAAAGYALGSPSLYYATPGTNIGMAPHTALAIVLLGAAGVWSRLSRVCETR